MGFGGIGKALQGNASTHVDPKTNEITSLQRGFRGVGGMTPRDKAKAAAQKARGGHDAGAAAAGGGMDQAQKLAKQQLNYGNRNTRTASNTYDAHGSMPGNAAGSRAGNSRNHLRGLDVEQMVANTQKWHDQQNFNNQQQQPPPVRQPPPQQPPPPPPPSMDGPNIYPQNPQGRDYMVQGGGYQPAQVDQRQQAVEGVMGAWNGSFNNPSGQQPMGQGMNQAQQAPALPSLPGQQQPTPPSPPQGLAQNNVQNTQGPQGARAQQGPQMPQGLNTQDQNRWNMGLY